MAKGRLGKTGRGRKGAAAGKTPDPEVILQYSRPEARGQPNSQLYAWVTGKPKWQAYKRVRVHTRTCADVTSTGRELGENDLTRYTHA